MRHFILVCFLLAGLAASATAEQTLLNGHITHGGYGGPVVKFTQFDGDFGVIAGGQGSWIINHSFGLGIGGYGLATNHHPRSVPAGYPWTPGETRADVGYCGAILSYVGLSDQLLHPTLDVLIGGGAIHGHRTAMGWDMSEDQGDWRDDGFFVLEPMASAELNLVSFMRLNAGVGYRLVSGVSGWGYSNQDVSGATASVVLKFGRF